MSTVVPYNGQAVHGDPLWYRTGIPLSALAAPPPDGTGCGPQSRAGLVLGAAGVQRLYYTQNGRAGLIFGGAGRQAAGEYQAGAAGLALGAAGRQSVGLDQAGAAGLVLGAAGVQYAAPFQSGAAGLKLGAAGLERIGLIQTGAAGIVWGVDTVAIPGYYLEVVRAAAQTIPANATTDISFDTAVYDPLGWWNAGTPTVVTIGLDGLYLITASLTQGGVAGQDAMWILLNGSRYSETRMQTASLTNWGNCPAIMAQLSLGDTIKLNVYNSIGFNTPTNPEQRPRLQIVRLGIKDP